MPAPDCLAKAKLLRDEWPVLPLTPDGIFPNRDAANQLLRLPVASDSCNNCRQAHAACLFDQFGRSCPLCLLKDKSDCSWALRGHFAKVVRTYRDGRTRDMYGPTSKRAFTNQFYADCRLAFLMFDCERSGPEATIAAGYFAFLHRISDSTMLCSILLLAYKYQCDEAMIERIKARVDGLNSILAYQALL
ncbi:hypothetical protein C8R46DRAFT_1215114 [Mycena filopes]|nr:hypothetical protein C8R46DRAFT_1215114 [Mycena filopes]